MTSTSTEGAPGALSAEGTPIEFPAPNERLDVVDEPDERDARDARDERDERDAREQDPPRARPRARPRAPAERDGFAFGPASGRSVTPPRSVLQQRAAEQARDTYEAYDDVLIGFDVEANAAFSMTLSREDNETDPETGLLIAKKGFLKRYEGTIPTQEDIAKEHGGGKYKAMIWGPKPEKGGKKELITNVILEISGSPIPPRRAGAFLNGKVAQNSGVADVVDKLTAANKESIEMVTRLLDNKNTPSEYMMRMLDPNAAAARFEDERKRRDAEYELERKRREEERKAERELREEERRAERQRLDDERKAREEDRKAELERIKQEKELELRLLQTKWEQERKQIELQYERDKTHVEAQTKLQIAQMQASQAAAEASAKMQIEQMRLQADMTTKTQAEQQQRMQEMQNQHQQTMQQLQQTALQQVQANADAQTKFWMAQANSNQGKGGLKEIAETIAIVDKIRGKDNDDDSDEPLALRVVEKAFEGVSKVAPGLFAAAGVRTSRQRVTEREDAEEVEPGSVAVVDERRRKKLKRRQPGDVVDGEVVDEKVAKAKERAKAAAVTPQGNDLVDFTFPAAPKNAQFDQATFMQLVELLVKNVDLAIQKNMEPKDIVEKVVNRFPDAVLQFLASMDTADVLSTLEGMPLIKNWAIVSNHGTEMMKAVHKIMQKSA